MNHWDLARLWSALAAVQPEQPALIHGDATLTWRQFDAAAAAAALDLQQHGIGRGDVVALCLPNRIEYLVLLAGAMRCGAAPCGVNYRYGPQDLHGLLHHIQPAAVFHDAARTAETAQARRDLPQVRRWAGVGGDEPDAISIEWLLQQPDASDVAGITSQPDDVLLKCTGGTTGRPVAVRWRLSDLLHQLNDHNPWHRHNLSGPVDAARLTVGNARLMVASPLMHGSGLMRALGALCAGGVVITLPEATYDPVGLLDTTAYHGADSLAIIGDAHALPLADALDADPGRWPLPDLRTITSSGVAWTQAVKQRLLRHLPHVRLLESLGATEATGLGFSTATAAEIPPTGRFTLGRHARILTPTRLAEPGETGVLGVSWPHPDGLHPHGQLPAKRYVTVAGSTYLLSGDHARLLPDRCFELLGRDEDCINTGGEKVYGPEVTDVLLKHPDVLDALVIGMPHPRLGSTVTAVVQLRPGTTTDDVLAFVRTYLASYKVPTAVVDVPAVPRTGAGKPDFVAARSLAGGSR